MFVSTNGGAAWLDRTAAGMMYYTKDVVIDPTDAAQNRWYAGVWGEWGNSSGLGGLYVTTNRGVSWVRWMTNISVGSCSIPTTATNELYITTELDGLWVCTNRFAPTPTFTQFPGYPFRFPSRVFFNPYDANEVWVTSFGNGLRLGRRVDPQPVIETLDVSTDAATRIRAASGQRLRVRTSSDQQTWTSGPRELVPDDLLTGRVSNASSPLFISVTAE